MQLRSRLGLVYVALFFLVGVYLPFWPVWLASRGMDPDRIGLLLGIGMWARVCAPWVGSHAGRHGNAGRWLLGLTLGALACMVAFGFASTFVALLLLSVALGLSFAPIVPLTDGLTLQAAAEGQLDYGRVRLWGSVAFIVASVAGGSALHGRAPELILTTIQALALLLVAATIGLPRVARPAHNAPPVRWTGLLRRTGVPTFLATAACLQGAHAVLYGFGTKYWLAVGIESGTIGLLWAVGVAAEIVLFAVGDRVLARVGATGLILIAALGHVVRWTALGSVTSVPVLLGVQLLHGATFGALHLGAMHWIKTAIPAPQVQQATALYVAVAGGLALGVGMLAAGMLYERLHGHAFYVMTGLAALGLVGALRLRHMRRHISATTVASDPEPSDP